MLARLFEGSSKNASIESKTEEDHSRALLWPSHSFDPYGVLALSPPKTPLTSSTFRVGPYDDRGGLEINDARDTRIIVAQDAFGAMDRPMVLFDSQKHLGAETISKPISTGHVTPRPTPQSPQKSQVSLFNASQRNRSSTMSGPASAFTRPHREVETNDKVNRLLDCMFGVTSATKSESSTKMHVLLAGHDQPLSSSQIQAHGLPRPASVRTPLTRARTSSQMSAGVKSSHPARDENTIVEDVVLVTRMFSITLPETKEALEKTLKPSDKQQVASDGGESLDRPPSLDEAVASKKVKLIEKKVPMYAVAAMLQLPPDDPRKTMSRPSSRNSLMSLSNPNSYGSDIASSWTLLDAIPDSLSSSAHSHRGSDRRIEHLTGIWDVILRSLTELENAARGEIGTMLHAVDRQIVNSMIKTPKGPHEQRTNQRNIFLREPLPPAEAQRMDMCSRLTQRRICRALRIPKVVTGTGLVHGHWLDEARYLVQACGMKSHNYFIFNLLTAFLGNHTEWLEKIGIDWCRKQGHVPERKSSRGNCSLSSRTVIIAEKRSLARRLIFLLASFLPSPQGVSAFEKAGVSTETLPTPSVSFTSPRTEVKQITSAREIGRPTKRAQHVSFGTADFEGLSTSMSSVGSVASRGSSKLPRPQPLRKDSDSASQKDLSRASASHASIHVRKSSTTNPATTPLPATSMPFSARPRASYFEEEAVDDSKESEASAGLQKILHRGSSTFAPSSVGSTWSSILGGLWSKRHEGAGLEAVPSTDVRQTSNGVHARSSDSASSNQDNSKLQAMVSEVSTINISKSPNAQRAASGDRGRNGEDAADTAYTALEAPRLRVDEHDGVIDVDVGMPGFLGWDADNGPISPSRVPLTEGSMRSSAGGRSLHRSLINNSPRSTKASDNPNVAGYLKRYHEDFSLQAVGKYEDLGRDIQNSMTQDKNVVGRVVVDSRRGTTLTEGDWVDVSTTLVADARKFSIERLTLQRKKISVAPEAQKDSRDSGTAVQAPVERFILEPVMAFDHTLTDAIEHILSAAAGSAMPQSMDKKGEQRSGPEVAGTQPSFTPPMSPGIFEPGHTSALKRTDCQQIVADALEEVVSSVSSALATTQKAQPKTRATGPQQENVLREGVKKWLLNVDHVQQREVW